MGFKINKNATNQNGWPSFFKNFFFSFKMHFQILFFNNHQYKHNLKKQIFLKFIYVHNKKKPLTTLKKKLSNSLNKFKERVYFLNRKVTLDGQMKIKLVEIRTKIIWKWERNIIHNYVNSFFCLQSIIQDGVIYKYYY